MVVLSTTPIMLITTLGKRMSFVIEADPGNTTNQVRISTQDNAVATSFVVLLKGQQQSFTNWNGTIWAVANASTPSVYVELVDDSGLGYTQKDPGV